jgi:hypothetical protein
MRPENIKYLDKRSITNVDFLREMIIRGSPIEQVKAIDNAIHTKQREIRELKVLSKRIGDSIPE